MVDGFVKRTCNFLRREVNFRLKFLSGRNKLNREILENK